MKADRKTTCSLMWIALLVVGMAVFCEFTHELGELFEREAARARVHFEYPTLERARVLAPYEIGVPAYLPADVEQEPFIPYLNVWPDGSAGIVLEYRPVGAPDLWTTASLCDIRQGYSPLDRPPADKPDAEALKKSLVQWLSAREVDSDTRQQVKSAIDEVEFQLSSHQSATGIKWVGEITKPPWLKANIIDWDDDHVGYGLYSVLATEEAIKIADSVSGDRRAAD